MGQTVNLLAYAFGGSNPSLPTIKGVNPPCGVRIMAIMPAFQAGGRGFEPRFPLHQQVAGVAQG